MTARVCTVSGSTVTLLPDSGIECFGCMAGECKKRPTLLAAENHSDTDLRPGQLVETVLPLGALVRDGGAALLPPLLGFMGGFFLVRIFSPTAGDAACAAAGVLFLFAGSAAAYVVRRRFPPKTRLAIKRVIGDA
jgi:positive regulator of sigma E activity